MGMEPGDPLPVAGGKHEPMNLGATSEQRIEAREQAGDPPHWIRPTAPETPEDAAILTDTVRIVSEVLAGLPLDVRIATEMYRFGGHTLEETAAHLGLSVATVHRHVRLALVRIALSTTTPPCALTATPAASSRLR